MKEEHRKQEMFNKVLTALKEFDKNLKNKNLMFVIEKQDKQIEKEEVFFPTSCFYHLTGINLLNRDGKKLNSYEFYHLVKNNRVNLKDFKLESKDGIADLKLEVLLQLMKIDRTANMIGDFAGNNIFLQTHKITGNVRACLGLVKVKSGEKYIPNTALKEDIRNITTNRLRIVAIFKKEWNEQLYQNITYLKKSAI